MKLEGFYISMLLVLSLLRTSPCLRRMRLVGIQRSTTVTFSIFFLNFPCNLFVYNLMAAKNQSPAGTVCAAVASPWSWRQNPNPKNQDRLETHPRCQLVLLDSTPVSMGSKSRMTNDIFWVIPNSEGYAQVINPIETGRVQS